MGKLLQEDCDQGKQETFKRFKEFNKKRVWTGEQFYKAYVNLAHGMIDHAQRTKNERAEAYYYGVFFALSELKDGKKS